MKATSVFGIIAGLAVCATAASAAPPARKATPVQARPHIVAVNNPAPAVPVSMQRVRMVDGHIVALGPVIPYTAGHPTRTNPQYAWDAYESGVSEASVPGLVPDGGRYILEWTAGQADYRYGVAVNQMVIDAQFQNQAATTMDYLFYQRQAAEPLSLLWFTGDVYDTTCTGPALTTLHDGVRINYAAGTGFFYSNVDLGANGLDIPLPATATGGFVVFLARDVDGQGNPIHSTDAQMGLWGTGDHNIPPQTRHGTEDASGYADDATAGTPAGNRATNNPDGIIQPANGECYAWNFGAPDMNPLCVSVGFGLKAQNNCRVDLNGDGSVNVQDFLTFFQLYAAGDPRADLNDDLLINVQDFLTFFQLYAAGC